MSLASIVYRGYGGTRQGQGNTDTIARRGYAAYTGLTQPPAAGYQYETYAGGGAGYWLGVGSSPAVVVGDVFVTQTTCSPGSYTVQVNADGTIEVFVSGDNSRQSFLYDIYRVASNAIDGPATVWINAFGPIWSNVVVLFNRVIGVSIGTVDLNTYCTSQWGDTLTFALVSGTLPPGLTLTSAGIISGIPTQAGNYTFTIYATDQSNTTSGSGQNYISVISVVVSIPFVIPPVVSAWTADATKVTADSINFTCDGADLINGGGTDVANPGGLARSVSQYLRF